MKHPLDPEDLSDEFPRRKKRYIQCSDGMCGGLDCPNCSPGNFRGGVYVGDIEESENMKTEDENQESPVGKFAVIAYHGASYIANVIDSVAGTNTPKRVRIQRDPILQGKVLMPGEYIFKQFTDSDD